MVYETTDEGIDAYEAWIRTPARVEPLRGELPSRSRSPSPSTAPPCSPSSTTTSCACLERLREHSARGAAAEGDGTGTWRLSSSAIARERATRLLNAEIEWVRDLRRSVAALGARPNG